MQFLPFGIQFENPLLLLLIIPAVIFLMIIIRRDFVSRLKRSELRKHIVRKRLFILTTRSLIFTLLILAMASPFTLQTFFERGDGALTVLVDNSTSMSALDLSEIPALKESLERQIPARFRNFAYGEVSPVGDAALSATTGQDNILLISDGRSNAGRPLGDMFLVAASANSTINAINLSASVADTAVAIEGARLTTNAEENEFSIIVSQIGEPQKYRLDVYIDDDNVLSESYSGSNVFSVSKKFAEGYHVIRAEIDLKDRFRQNNVFSKTVKVEQKPKVLLVTRDSTPLSEIMNKLYRTTKTETLSGQDIKKYSAVILNNIPESETDAQALSDYVIEGNGLVVFGGSRAYDRGGYKDSVFETILPVRVGKGGEGQNDDASIALVIDISGSTRSGFKSGGRTTVKEVEKALAIGILKDLRKTDRVAVIAFNTDAFVVSDLGMVLGREEHIEDRISRLAYAGGTRIDEGIKAARKILAPLEGSKSIIIFSDGRSTGRSDDVYNTKIAADTGIKTYAVGVGEGTDRKHMQDIARAGNGIYFEPGESEKLALIFGEPEDDESENFPVEIINSHHFITYNVQPSAAVTGFNQVVPKSNADLLVATQQNNPLMSSSRLGLGRIVAVSTDDGSFWSSELLSSKNSLLISRAINWAIGDLGRNKDFDVDVRDVFLGDRMEVSVISGSEPEHDSLNFSKTGKRSYVASFIPKETGIQEFFGASGAVNYPEEYAALGMNPSLEEYVSLTGGKLFNPEDVRGLVEKARADSRRPVSEPTAFSWMLLLAALVVFLAEVSVRLIQERREK